MKALKVSWRSRTDYGSSYEEGGIRYGKLISIHRGLFGTVAFVVDQKSGDILKLRINELTVESRIK